MKKLFNYLGYYSTEQTAETVKELLYSHTTIKTHLDIYNESKQV